MPERSVQPYSLDKAVELIQETVNKQVRRLSGAPVVLGISGIDCSGKTTLAKALLGRFVTDELSAELVMFDDFIIPRSDRKSEGSPVLDYFEHTFDRSGFADRIESLKQKADLQLLIGEGVFLFRKELVGLWDQKVWIEMSTEQSVECGSGRDAQYFGSPEKAKAEYLNRFMPAHEHHLERDRPSEQADLVFQVE